MQFRQFVKGFKIATNTSGNNSAMISATIPHTLLNNANEFRRNENNVTELSQIVRTRAKRLDHPKLEIRDSETHILAAILPTTLRQTITPLYHCSRSIDVLEANDTPRALIISAHLHTTSKVSVCPQNLETCTSHLWRGGWRIRAKTTPPPLLIRPASVST